MLFTSDNWAGVHPEIFKAMERANNEPAPAYGMDGVTAQAKQLFCDFFEKEVDVFFTTTGGSANGLALSQYTPPYGAVVCHKLSHINMDEAGTPEFYTGGAKLITIEGEGAKLTLEAVKQEIDFYFPPIFHHVKPKVLSLTQGTELGTVYSVDEVQALSALVRSYDMKVHMDGARLSNALATLNCSPANITWRAGVDVLSFGATKNGAMAAEAIVFFNKEDTDEFAWRHKRTGHVWSKNRFMAAQWQGFLEKDLWLSLAQMANTRALELRAGLETVDRIELPFPTQINEVFAVIPDDIVNKAMQAGMMFYTWDYPVDRFKGQLRRLVTSYQTTEEDIAKAIEVLKC